MGFLRSLWCLEQAGPSEKSACKDMFHKILWAALAASCSVVEDESAKDSGKKNTHIVDLQDSMAS